MKTFLTATWCLFLTMSCVSPAGAQQQPPATPPATPQQTTPPPEQVPLAQPQPGIRQPPPPLPKIPDVRQPGETGWWVGISGWVPRQTPIFDKGANAGYLTSSHIKMQGKPKVAQGAEAGVALGLHNALKMSYFESRAAGNFTNNVDLHVWDQGYTAGNYVSTNYRVQNFKLSFEYLTWPYPVESRRFRLKTLWQVQYTGVRTVFDLPKLPLVDSTGTPLVDASGNPLSYAAQGSRYFILPTFGLGIAEYYTRNFRIEANASGFAIPHRSSIWDADATANYRFGHFELRFGGKAFHFKTSTKAAFFLRNTMASAMIGLRWYSD